MPKKIRRARGRKEKPAEIDESDVRSKEWAMEGDGLMP
jgi:hypothetical protein